MTMRTYQVPDISCDHCRNAIESAVSEVAGVDGVTVDIQARSVSVEGDAEDAAIRSAIGDAGYAVSDA